MKNNIVKKLYAAILIDKYTAEMEDNKIVVGFVPDITVSPYETNKITVQRYFLLFTAKSLNNLFASLRYARPASSSVLYLPMTYLFLLCWICATKSFPTLETPLYFMVLSLRFLALWQF